ncbi:MAG TPA: ABC transporter permease, partial [Cyanobacteria bacterium UBA8543]|nr:ABC transporter permease [Cyanobacteria bacterium UBA8543]
MKGSRCKKILIYAGLIFYSIITFLPFAWALSASFKTLSEISLGGMDFIPQYFTLDNYKKIFIQEPLFG